jgi:hypothetical protein
VVFLALSHEAAIEAIALARVGGHHVWVGADALSQDDHSAQVKGGANITRFAYSLGDSDTAIEEAVATIREHHPSETVWVNARSAPDEGR